MDLLKLKQVLGMAFLNSGIGPVFTPIEYFFKRIAYTIQYSNWYRKNSLRTQLLPTENRFGYANRYKLYQYIAEKYDLDKDHITYLEYGVASGGSLTWWVEKNINPKSRFIGFDTFSGLPEDWGNIPKGTFSTGGVVPDIKDERLSYEIGLFQKTLPNFLRIIDLTQSRAIIHIDCDLYSASLYVLIMLSPILKKGDIIMFDEFADVMNEYRAYRDFVDACGINLTFVKAVNSGHKVAFIVSE